MLTLTDLTHKNGERTVIEKLSFSSAARHGILALVGPSGCGKTTLLSLIADPARITQGSIAHDYQKIAVAFQEPRLIPWLSLEENLNFVLSANNTSFDLKEQLLQKFDLEALKNTRADALSGGEQQRASLLRALLFGGDLVLLDEPFTALDKARKNAVTDAINEAARSAFVIVTAHDKSDLEGLDATAFEMVGSPVFALRELH